MWNSDVHKFCKANLGATVTITRASVSLYQGKKSLVMGEDSTVVIGSAAPTPVDVWRARHKTEVTKTRGKKNTLQLLPPQIALLINGLSLLEILCQARRNALKRLTPKTAADVSWGASTLR